MLEKKWDIKKGFFLLVGMGIFLSAIAGCFFISQKSSVKAPSISYKNVANPLSEPSFKVFHFPPNSQGCG